LNETFAGIVDKNFSGSFILWNLLYRLCVLWAGFVHHVLFGLMFVCRWEIAAEHSHSLGVAVIAALYRKPNLLAK